MAQALAPLPVARPDRSPQPDIRPNVRSLFVRIYMLTVCFAGGIAGAFIMGGESRFSGASFKGPRALVSWLPLDPHLVWGAGFLTFSLVLVAVLGRSLAVHALRFGVVLYFFLALSFGGSVATDPKAAASGMVTYFLIAILHLFLQDHLHARGWEGC